MDASAALSTQLSVSTALRFEGPIQKKVALLVVMETSGPRRNNLKPVIESVQPAGAIDQILHTCL
jgi:hypothetical protein